MPTYHDEHTGAAIDCLDDVHRDLVAAKCEAYYRWRATVERETAGDGRRHWKSANTRDVRIRAAYNRHERAAAALAEYVRSTVHAVHAAAGQPLESAELDGMTPEQMRDELTYLADYQG